MFKEYFKELKGLEVYEEENGFVLYRITVPILYIRDIYVKPEQRRSGLASTMADEVILYAKSIGCNLMVGDVEPSNAGANASIKVLLAYGMRVYKANDDEILFVKDI